MLERGVWTLKDDAKSKFKKAGKFLSGLANQVIANQTGVDIKTASEDISSNSQNIAKLRK